MAYAVVYGAPCMVTIEGEKNHTPTDKEMNEMGKKIYRTDEITSK